MSIDRVIPSQQELLEIPEHACGPVMAALGMIHRDINEAKGYPGFPVGELRDSIFVANKVARACGSMCASGCVRDLHFAMEEKGLELPPSQERDELFDIVSTVLAAEVIFGPSEAEKPKLTVIELPPIDGDQLKDLVMRRINILTEDSLAEKMLGHFTKDDGTDLNVEEYKQMWHEILTPINEDFWNELARTCEGSVRAALHIVAYLQSVFPYFRSDSPEDKRIANDISTTKTYRDEDYIETRPGFSPANPNEITAADVLSINALINEHGSLHLPQGFGGYSVIRVKDNN